MPLDLTMAAGDYDHTRALHSGVVEPDGVSLNPLIYPAPERHRRGIDLQEFDICEISFGSYLTAQASEDEFPFTAIPVFPHRRFRHSYFFKHVGADISDPSEFAGKSIGLESWQTTSGIWMRGIAAEQYDLNLTDVTWYFDQPEDLELDVSDQYDVRSLRDDQDMEQACISGELDGLMYPVVLDSVKREGGIERVVEDSLSVEQAYYEETGIFPIMHTVVIRNSLIESNPWLPVNVLRAFEEARDICLEKLEDPRWTALAWARQHLEHQQSVLGQNPWPYGLTDENWMVIQKLQQYSVDQGIIPRRYKPSELFESDTIAYEPKKHLSGSHG